MTTELADAIRVTVRALPDTMAGIVGEELERSARIGPAATEHLLRTCGEDVERLMLRLLPVARAYALVPVSDFPVGAVARVEGSAGETSFVLGCNLETPGLPLSHTVHAEQAAAARAFHTGATRLVSLAVSAPPCGHCRQFLHELSTEGGPDLLLPGEDAPRRIPLNELLPRAFGPADLGITHGILDHRPDAALSLSDGASGDPLVAAALDAARRSHAPYTGNHAGVALDVGTAVVRGSYLENAAFNPGLSPLHVARINLHLGLPLDATVAVRRAILVEAAATCSQAPAARALLGAIAPGVDLEVRRAARGRGNGTPGR